MTDEIWVIEENNTPVAYMILTPVPDALYLGKVAVAQSHRGLGLARVMVDHAQRRAQEMNRTTLRLETRIELIENHLAFAALGFHKTSETAHRGYDSPTGIAMERPVPPR